MTNATEIEQLRKDIAREAYIDEYLENFKVAIENVTAIDNQFKRALFAQWVRNSTDFPKFKTKYRTLLVALHGAANVHSPAAAAKAKTKASQRITIENSWAAINETTRLSPITVQLNATTQANVLVPRNLQWALFDEWPQKMKVVRVLGKFAKDMELPTVVTNVNGTQIILRPQDPPSWKGGRTADYNYAKYGKHLFNITFDSFVRFTNKRVCERINEIQTELHFN